MPTPPHLGGREVIRVVNPSLGRQFVRPAGGHLIAVRAGATATRSVPDPKAVAKETPRGIIRAAGMIVAEFIAAL